MDDWLALGLGLSGWVAVGLMLLSRRDEKDRDARTAKARRADAKFQGKTAEERSKQLVLKEQDLELKRRRQAHREQEATRRLAFDIWDRL